MDNGYVYVIIGKGVKEHARLVKELSLENYVFLLEEVSSDTLARCYNSSSVFFSPSIVEGFSLVSIEAINSGLPLVVTDVPGNRDVVRDNGCGIIVKSKDIMSMANAIQKILTSENLRHYYIDRSLKSSEKYDWNNIAKMYFEVYKKVAKKRRKYRAQRKRI